MENHFSYAVAIIKPDAHRDVLAEMITRDFEEGGLSVVFRKDIVLSQTQAGEVYIKEPDQSKFHRAAKSLLGTDRDKFSTLVILKAKNGGEGVSIARDIKGKIGRGGIRDKYNLHTKDELEKMGLTGEELGSELSRNRLHVPDTDKEMLEIIDMFLIENERMELKDREPELYSELMRFNENREIKNEFLEKKNWRPK
jgi:nucleoside diphosphate kinase